MAGAGCAGRAVVEGPVTNHHWTSRTYCSEWVPASPSFSSGRTRDMIEKDLFADYGRRKTLALGTYPDGMRGGAFDRRNFARSRPNAAPPSCAAMNPATCVGAMPANVLLRE